MTELSRMFDSMPVGPDRTELAAAFDSTAPAEMLPPVPAGVYTARWVDGALDESRKGTPFFQARFEITSGEYVGRRLAHRWYLSAAALPYSRRDLAALGFDCFAKLQAGSVPSGLVRLHVALRRDDSGVVFNQIREVLPGGPEASPTKTTAFPPAPVTPESSAEPAAPVVADDLPSALRDDTLL